MPPFGEGSFALDFATYVRDFAAAMKRVDATRPRGASSRGDRVYQPGIGPHTEDQTVAMVMANISEMKPIDYPGSLCATGALPFFAPLEARCCVRSCTDLDTLRRGEDASLDGR